MDASGKIRLAILGCGAITRCAHLPVTVAHPEVRLTALVDSDLKRAEALANAFRVECKLVRDAREILPDVDAVINALPNHLHVSVSLQALHAGVHVLCEKPLALTVAEARTCCEAAAERGVVLAVGMNRRFEASTLSLNLVLHEGLIDRVQEYNWEYGAPYEWNSASGFYFTRAQAGGGVLLDYGVHMLDNLVYWFGPVTRFDYQDDNLGSGIEANAILALQHSGEHGEVSGRVRLSRTYLLSNRLVVRGAKARAEITLEDPSAVVLYRQIQGHEMSMTIQPEGNGTRQTVTSFSRQLDNFVQSIKGRQKPMVDGWQALSITELVESCYQQARRLPEPWSELGQTIAR